MNWLRLALLVLPLALASACGGATAAVSTEHRELPPVNPAAVRKFSEGARILARGGVQNENRAMQHFREALEIDPNIWEAHYNLGVIFRRRNDFVHAIESFEAARRIQPASRDALLALAEARYASGGREVASNLLSSFLTTQPTAVDVRVALATMLRERGEYNDALEQAREALVREPQNARALAEIGRVYRAREQYDVAELVFKKALELTPQSADLHNDLGLLALARGDTQEAFLEFRRAIEIDARFSPAHLNQASVLLHAGDYEGAAVEFRAVLHDDDEHLDARVGLGICLRGQGQHRDAQREYERVLEISENYPAALFNLAILKAEFLNQRPQARDLFQRFLDTGAATDSQREVAERYRTEIGAETAPEGGGR